MDLQNLINVMQSNDVSATISALDEYLNARHLGVHYKKSRRSLLFAKLSELERSGFGHYGVYKLCTEFINTNRSQSVAEHSASATFDLAIVKTHRVIVPICGSFYDMLAMNIHDFCELFTGGDRDDDGTIDIAEKTKQEIAIFRIITKSMHWYARWQVMKRIVKFQEKKGLLYKIDKNNALVFGLLYESEGRPGDLCNFHPGLVNATAQDLSEVEATGSTSIPDMWGWHYRKNTSRDEDPDVDKMFLAMYHDIRQYHCPWWLKK